MPSRHRAATIDLHFFFSQDVFSSLFWQFVCIAALTHRLCLASPRQMSSDLTLLLRPPLHCRFPLRPCLEAVLPAAAAGARPRPVRCCCSAGAACGSARGEGGGGIRPYS
jgi:hypothetical protein